MEMCGHRRLLLLQVAVVWLLAVVGLPIRASTPSKTYHRYHQRQPTTTAANAAPLPGDGPSPAPTADDDDESSGSGSSDYSEEEEEDDELTSLSDETQVLGGTRRRRNTKKRSFFRDFGASAASTTGRRSEPSTTTQQRTLQLWKQRRQDFLDRIALVSASLLKKEEPHLQFEDPDAELLLEEHHPHHHRDDDQITPQTDLTLPGRQFHIVTTAALPWMTGTAVNPLLRAAYLHRRTQQINQLATMGNGNNNNNSTLAVQVDINMDVVPNNNDTFITTDHHRNVPQNQQWVTLVIPWLELEEDQQELYGQVFASPADQEAYIRNWLANDAGMPDVADPEHGLRLLFYPARYHSGLRSIFAMGDMIELIVADSQETHHKTDVCILEEPEHCNWFRAPGQGWTQPFTYVIGIVHTNYKEYASAQYHGLWTAPAISMISSAMVRAYCHQVIKLSDVLQTFAPEKEATSNVHGVREDFLQTGLRRAANNNHRRGSSNNSTRAVVVQASAVASEEGASANANNQTQVYFIGKLLWAKGLDLMLELQDYYKQCTGQYFAIDIYGSGPEQKAIERAYWGRRHHYNQHKKHPHHHGSSYLNGDNATMETPFETQNGSSTDAAANNRYPQTRPRRRIFLPQPQRAIRQRLQRLRNRMRMAKANRTSLQQQSKELFQKINETLQTTELPTTVHEFRRQPIPATFPGRVDHAKVGDQYKVFVNPSISEVLCTTTAEALAMGKFVIIPVHPSNTFFLKFPNCLAYRNKFEFAANLKWALTHEPEPLTPELAHEFTWEAATDRLLRASAVTLKQARKREKLGLSKRDERIAWFHKELGKGPKGDLIRKVLGAGPVSAQVKYVMEQSNNKTAAEEDEEEEETDKPTAEEGDSDSDDDGLTRKLRRSSFAEALRATLANGLPSIL